MQAKARYQTEIHRTLLSFSNICILITHIMASNCGTLQIIFSRRTALHGGKAYEDYGRFHTIRAN